MRNERIELGLVQLNTSLQFHSYDRWGPRESGGQLILQLLLMSRHFADRLVIPGDSPSLL